MSEPKQDKNKRGANPSFDFLGEEAANRPSRPSKRADGAESGRRKAPIIRKPVPIEKLGSIAESGLPADHDVASGASSQPASPTRPDPNDDLDFLGPPARRGRAGQAPAARGTGGRPGGRDEARPARRPAAERPTSLDDIDDEFSEALRRPRGAPVPSRGARGTADAPVDEFDRNWREGVHPVDPAAPRRRPLRAMLLLCALGLLGTGAWFVWDRELASLPVEWPWQGADADRGDTAAVQTPPAAEIAEPVVPAENAAPRPAPLAQRFHDQLSALETLMADGDLAAAEQALQGMDRTVYGYGRTEFDAIAEQIREINGEAEAERQAAAREAAEAQRQAEAEREAAADREREEAEQQAAEQARAAAAARQAEIEAEQLRQAEAQRREALARQAERDRQAEADREIQAQEAADARQAQNERDIQNAEARRAAAVRARQAAIEAQARADAEARARAAQRQEAETAAAGADLPISDADLQEVYSRFLELATAIEQRDINTVIDLTQPSGARIQQFLQIFENTQTVYTRIASMATRRAEGVIVGNLIIDRLVRADGTIVDAPAAIQSIRLSSARTPDGWSAIEW